MLHKCVLFVFILSVFKIKDIASATTHSPNDDGIIQSEPLIIESQSSTDSNNDIQPQEEEEKPNFDGLSDMEIVRIQVLPPGNSVTLSWGKPIREYDLNLTFGVYYGFSVDEAMTEPKLSTKSLYATVEHLDFCSKYVFAVGVLSNKALLEPPRNVRSIGTHIDRTSPPTDLLVEFLPLDRPCLLIKWAASCANIGEPLGYLVTVFEKGTSWMAIRWVPKSVSADLAETIPVLYGKHYEVKVTTDYPEANATDKVAIKVPEFLQPFKVRVTSEEDGTFIVFWREPYVPPYVGRFIYEVYVYPNADLEEQYEIFQVEKPVFLHKGNLSLYAFMVGLRSTDGVFGSTRLTDPVAKPLDGDAFTLEVS